MTTALSALFATTLLGLPGGPAHLAGSPPARPTALCTVDASLWLGTEQGLYRAAPGGWRLALASLEVRDLAARRGAVAVATPRGLYHVSTGADATPELRLPVETHALAVDAAGVEWVATERGLYRQRRDPVQAGEGPEARGAPALAARPGDWMRDLDLPAGPVLAVRSAGHSVWVARAGGIWRSRAGARFEPVLSGLADGWWELRAVTRLEDETLLFVPAGAWRVPARADAAPERVGLPLGRVNDAVQRGDELYLATPRGLFRMPARALGHAAPERVLHVPSLRLHAGEAALLVATSRGVARADGPPGPPPARVSTAQLSAAAGPRQPGPAGGAAPSLLALSRARTLEVVELQRAVLDYLDLRPERLRDLERRARRSGRLPELRLSFGYDHGRSRDRRHDQTWSSGAVRDLIDATQERDGGGEVSLQLSWDLDRLVAPDHAIAISRERRELIELRDQVLERTTRLYFERRRVLARLSMLSGEREEERVELLIRLDELAGQLDAWSGGFFSRARPDSSPTTRRNP